MHRSFFVENKYDYDMITGFLPVAKVSKGQQKSVISIGQQKSQQFQTKVSNFYNYHRMPYLKIMLDRWFQFGQSRFCQRPKPMFHKIVICACNVLL